MVLCGLLIASAGEAQAADNSGRWKGSATANYGSTSVCSGWLEYDLTAKEERLTGKLVLSRQSKDIDTKIESDGSFDLSYVTPSGTNIEIKGKIGDGFTAVSAQHGCGWKDIPLKSHL
jgi:hypothetical protein